MNSAPELRAFAAFVQAALAAGLGFDPAAGETVLTPDGNGPGHWVGAPSVVVAPESERVLMAYRRRRPRDGSPQERGYAVAVGVSDDGGRAFAPIWQVTKEEVGTSSLERFCLRWGRSGDWWLYTSWEAPPCSGRWQIGVVRAGAPEQFDIAHVQPVVTPGDVGVDAVKDPYVIDHEGVAVMYISTFLTAHGPAPTSVATSDDGLRFAWRGQALAVGGDGAWDAYQARLSCVLAFDGGYIGFYDGAASPADDTEEHCGMACSLDLMTWQPLSLDGPLFISPNATRSLRYVDVVQIAGTWWAYYEYTRVDGSHELRRSQLTMSDTAVTKIGTDGSLGAKRARPPGAGGA